jgi:hypothetical protein
MVDVQKDRFRIAQSLAEDTVDLNALTPRSNRRDPDISDILARKAEGRRELASRSFGEKIEMLEAMRARTEPIRRAREARRTKWMRVSEPFAASKSAR